MVEEVSLSKSVRHKLDPLDQEMLERAFDATWKKVKGKDAVDFDSDDGLESILRQELIEIACCVLYGVSDPEALRKMLLSQPVQKTPECRRNRLLAPSRPKLAAIATSVNRDERQALQRPSNHADANRWDCAHGCVFIRRPAAKVSLRPSSVTIEGLLRRYKGFVAALLAQSGRERHRASMRCCRSEMSVGVRRTAVKRTSKQPRKPT